MGKQTCKDCNGYGRFQQIGIAPGYGRHCPTCDGDGRINRTGPYRLADGTWSDGVDRQLPLSDRSITAGRYEVTRSDWEDGGWIVFFMPHEEMFGCHQRGFDTQAEAIAYADNLARTTKNGGA